MKRARAAIAIALVLLQSARVASLSAQTEYPEPQPTLASLFLERAISYRAQGLIAEANRDAAQSCGYDAASSDALYLYASTIEGAVSGGSGLPFAIRACELALGLDNFRVFEGAECRLLLAGLYERQGEPSRALETVRFAPDRGFSFTDPELALVALRCLYKSGDYEGYSSFALRCAERFPEDPRFAVYLLGHTKRPSGYVSYGGDSGNEWIAKPVRVFLSRIDTLGYRDNRVWALAADLLPLPEAREAAIRAYKASCPGPDSLAALLMLEHGLLDEFSAIREFFHESARIDRAMLERFVALVSTPRAIDALALALSTYSGEIFHDPDMDDIPESRFSFRNGALERWISDESHHPNGIVEVWFAGGEPYRAEAPMPQSESWIDLAHSEDVPSQPGFLGGAISGLDARCSIAIGRYPSIETLSLLRNDGLVVQYRFSPGAFAFGLLSMETVDARGMLRLPEPTVHPVFTSRMLWGSALTVTLSDATGRTLASVFLERGIPIRKEERRGSSGLAITDYRDGFPALERIDGDGDGRFEERVSWRREDLAAYRNLSEIDADGDGIFEYSERLYPHPVKYWDYDNDGVFDAVMESLPDGSVVLGFSTHFDGHYDSRIVVPESGLVSDVRIFRRELAVAIVPDKLGNVYWIGAKVFDLSRAPVRDGITTVLSSGGATALVRAVYFENAWFIEEYR